MSLKAWKVLGIAACIVALANAGVAGAMGGCTACLDTTTGGCAHMACFYTFHAVALLQVLGAIAIAGVAFVKCKVGRRWLAAACIAAQALTVICMYTPVGGLCANAEMSCHTTALAVTVLAVVICVACIVAIALADPKRAQMPKRGL